MNKLVLAVGLLCYLTTAVVVMGQFSSATTPREVRFGTVASYFGLAAFVYLMLRDKHSIPALVVLGASLALLLWAAKTTRSTHLRLAFDPGAPGLLGNPALIATFGIRFMRPTSCFGSGVPSRLRTLSCSFF